MGGPASAQTQPCDVRQGLAAAQTHASTQGGLAETQTRPCDIRQGLAKAQTQASTPCILHEPAKPTHTVMNMCMQ